MRSKKGILQSVAMIGLAAVSAPAWSVPIVYEGAEFSAVVSGSGSSYTLALSMDFRNATNANEYLGDRLEAWSLQLPGSASSSLLSAPLGTSGWTLYESGKAVGGNNGCGSGNVASICVDRGGNSQLHGTGPIIGKELYTWTVSVVFDSPNAFAGAGNFHLLTVREVCSQQQVTSGTGRNRQTATQTTCEWKKDAGLLSQDLSFDRPTEVPEPATLGLLGLGLAALGLVSRRRRAV